MSPQRIQRKRTKGWRKPDGAIYVGRGSGYGNPFTVGPLEWECADRAEAARLHRDWMLHPEKWSLPAPPNLSPLCGRDLMCWCPDDNCHAVTLLELANGADL